MDFKALDESENRLNERLQELGRQFLALQSGKVREPERVVVLTIHDQRVGTLVFVCRTQEVARRQLVRYVRRWWPFSTPHGLPLPIPADGDEAVVAYFNGIGGTYTLDVLAIIEQVEE